MTARTIFLAFVALLVCQTISLAADPAAPATQPAKLRVGVYDSRAVAVAYVRSGAEGAKLKELTRQRDDAKAKGDAKLVQQIESQGQQLQTLRHLQGFSNAPIDDILAQIKDKLPQIAANAGVDVIVARTDYLSAGAQTVDVTDSIVALFNPDQNTQKILTGLRKHEPVPMLQVLSMKD